MISFKKINRILNYRNLNNHSSQDETSHTRFQSTERKPTGCERGIFHSGSIFHGIEHQLKVAKLLES